MSFLSWPRAVFPRGVRVGFRGSFIETLGFTVSAFGRVRKRVWQTAPLSSHRRPLVLQSMFFFRKLPRSGVGLRQAGWWRLGWAVALKRRVSQQDSITTELRHRVTWSRSAVPARCVTGTGRVCRQSVSVACWPDKRSWLCFAAAELCTTTHPHSSASCGRGMLTVFAFFH